MFYCINKVKHFLSTDALHSLYFALIHPHLSYCPITTSCAINSNILKIQKFQKKTICIISNKQYLDHTVRLFKSLNMLPFHQLITYSKLNFRHSIIYNYCPKSFHNIWITNNEHEERQQNLRNADHLEITHPGIELYKNSRFTHYLNYGMN